ncbi:hypothetical protein FACS189472_02240 [Alphaproteobacteria bacterium]|nr:hypothetical protein FACS189472_02240 [Alphaproteobacteria bacterium]
MLLHLKCYTLLYAEYGDGHDEKVKLKNQKAFIESIVAVAASLYVRILLLQYAKR